MKKLNNKGFMLIEILIVSIFVSSILIVLFLQFKKINYSYDVSFKYNTVDGLYLLNNVKKRIITNPSSDNIVSNSYDYYKNNLSANKFINIYSKTKDGIVCKVNAYDCNLFEKMEIKQLFIVGKDSKSEILNDKNLSITFRDYITYMNFSVDVGLDFSDYFIVAEFNDNTYASVNIKHS